MLSLKFVPYMTTASPYILKYEAIRADMTKSVTSLQVSDSQYLVWDFSMYNENADPDQHYG
ncbi:unnamed protein product [Discosporangium mesarthrocarpum]